MERRFVLSYRSLRSNVHFVVLTSISDEQVFGRRFEKELVQLRREMEALQIQIANTPNASPVVSALVSLKSRSCSKELIKLQDTSAEIEPLDLERKEQ